jgi:hypothetical protein
MGRLFTTRRSEWLPGIAVLGASVGVAAALGLSFGVRHWALYAGLVVALLLLYASTRRRDVADPEAVPVPEARGKPKLLRRGAPPYDLETDQSTENQKYLM